MNELEVLDEALEALLVRVRWYVSRRYAVPPRMARAFNRLCDILGKPDVQPWQRFP